MSLSRKGRWDRLRGPIERLLVPGARPFTLKGLLVAVLGPSLVTLVASLLPHRAAAVPALLYLLAVVAAGAIGHVWPALLAAGL